MNSTYIPRHKNLGTLFQNRCFELGHERTWLRYKSQDQWKDLSWEEVNRRVIEVGCGLISMGATPGGRISIWSENRPEWIITDLAILSIGCISVPIYPTLTAHHAAEILKHASASWLFASNAQLIEKLSEFRKDLPELKQIVAFDPNTHDVSFDSLRTKGRELKAQRFFERLSKVESKDVATIIYTSGTSGEPKGVMLTHENVLFDAEAACRVIPLERTDTCLSFLPLSHALERTAGCFAMLHQGSTIAFAQGLNTLPDDLIEIHPTLLICVPRILEKFAERVELEIQKRPKLVQHAFKKAKKTGPLSGIYNRVFFQKIREKFGGSLRFVICGGARLEPSVDRFFDKAGIHIYEGYGLTEAAPIVSVNAPAAKRPETVGKPLPNVEVRLAEDGEILVRGPNVMKGYFHDEAATADAIDANGFLHTGDIGQIDSDGFLKLLDRKKELIVTSGGKNIAPSPIEGFLLAHPTVRQACVVGDGRKYLAALIVPNFDAIQPRLKETNLDRLNHFQIVSHPTVRQWFGDLVQEWNAKASSYETIKKFELLAEEFSVENGLLTPTLKLRRKAIEAAHALTIAKIF